MSRNFPDFITAYSEYAREAFCPPLFHTWTGISSVAAALERKVWQDRGTFLIYPNLYVMLIAAPGIGKSTAGNLGNELLRQVGTAENRICFLANQSNPASFVKQFLSHKTFYVGDDTHRHSSCYFYASEGSNALGESSGKQGKILPALTEFYDCPKHWDKALVVDKVPPLRNVCCNMLACVTFSFLQELLPDREAAGGFASRIIYVVYDEKLVRTPKWRTSPPSHDTEEKLVEDLNEIYSLTGEYSETPEVRERFEQWFPRQDAHSQGLTSEKMQQFLARKATNVAKLMMVCAASESNEMVLHARHWDRAMAMIEGVESSVHKIVENAKDVSSPKGVSYNVMKTIEDSGGDARMLTREQLFSSLIADGTDMTKIDLILQSLHRAGLIRMQNGSAGSQVYRLIGDPKDYL